MRTNKAYPFISLAIVAAILSAGFSSCTGRSPKKDAEAVAEETIKKEIEEYAYPLPSAFEVTRITSYNVCYTKLLRDLFGQVAQVGCRYHY